MNQSSSKFWCIVPAAGVGSRFSADIPKQFHQLNGQLVAQHTLSRLLKLSIIEAIYAPCDLASAYWSKVPATHDKRVHLIAGGSNRAQSVVNGLSAINGFAADNDWVLVHDMARPCVTPENIGQLIAALVGHPVGGILAATINDTLKLVDAEKQILETANRSLYRAAQTPQMFRYGLLKNAIQSMLQEQIIPTDEASAMEYCGHSAQVVEGRQDNIKITKREDLAIAAAIIKNQEIEGCV
jgi:2-C-methyl-D-erythritol 4-phosphate cytidylyltransferase